MHKTALLPLLLLFCLLPGGFVFGDTEHLLLFQVAPLLDFPLLSSAQEYRLGAGADLSVLYPLPSFQPLRLGIRLEYRYLPYKDWEGATAGSLSFASGGAVADLAFQIIKNLYIGGFLSGGYFYGFSNQDPTIGGHSVSFDAGFSLSYRLLPFLSLGAKAQFSAFVDLLWTVAAGLTLTYHFLPRDTRPLIITASEDTGPGVDIVAVALDPLFPVFYSYYDDHPIGSVTVRNNAAAAVDNVRVSVLVEQYMDQPKGAEPIARLQPGEEAELPVFALFTDAVLGITEGTKAAALLTVSYLEDGKERTRSSSESLRFHNRNALTWDDDRKVCAFVTAKDPAVQKFAKNVAGQALERKSMGIDTNLLLAAAVHEALDLLGLRYVVDPQTPYAEASKSTSAIDYLQFPNQTLDYLAGDCDDLSVLYASLLEALGVPTAFVTTPGHIFPAFALSAPAEEAARTLTRPEYLILQDGRAWLPLEATLRGAGFLAAWESGAQQWRRAQAAGSQGFIPVRAGWGTYAPVGFAAGAEPKLPDPSALRAAFRKQVNAFVRRELAPKEAELKRELQQQPSDPKVLNKLGVLYARFGQNDEAREAFQKAVAVREYAPSLMNLGNLHFLDGRFKEAQSLYERAERLEPENPRLLLALARTAHALENYGSVRESYEKLQRLDPQLAARYTYLGLRGEEAQRAADADQERTVVWEEER